MSAARADLLLPEKLIRTAATLARLPAAYASSALGALRRRALFEEVRGFCLFLGYPRSGHSIFGALLDAHPDVIIGNELNVLRYVRLGFARNQIYQLLMRSSESRERDEGDGRYDYRVPGQWQGRCRSLRIIGDKKGMGTTLWVQKNPGILAQLRRRVSVPLKVIHVTRSPFDTIATMYQRGRDGATTLEKAADLYFRLCTTVETTRPLLAADELFEVRHEELVTAPEDTLRRLCNFIGVEAEPTYVAATAAIVYGSPHRSRLDVEWPEETLERISRRISATAYLQGYAFDD